MSISRMKYLRDVHMDISAHDLGYRRSDTIQVKGASDPIQA